MVVESHARQIVSCLEIAAPPHVRDHRDPDRGVHLWFLVRNVVSLEPGHGRIKRLVVPTFSRYQESLADERELRKVELREVGRLIEIADSGVPLADHHLDFGRIHKQRSCPAFNTKFA